MNYFSLKLDTLLDIRALKRELRSRQHEFESAIKPYVYIVFHKTENTFYFGFRAANKHPPAVDLGNYYFTSTSSIKRSPESFHFFVLGAFRKAERAYAMEQRLIRKFIHNPRCLNRHWQKPNSFTLLGAVRRDLAEFNVRTKSKARVRRRFTCCGCGKAFYLTHLPSWFDNHTPRKYCTKACATRHTASGRIPWNKGLTTGRPAWNRGLRCPNAAANGRKGAAALSKKVTGRRMATHPDGHRSRWSLLLGKSSAAFDYQQSVRAHPPRGFGGFQWFGSVV